MGPVRAAVIVIRQIKRLAPAFKLIFGLSAVMIVFVVVGLSIGGYYALPEQAVEFLVFKTVLNVYIWTLAIAYTPLSSDHYALQNDDQSAWDEIELSLSVGGNSDGRMLSAGL